jgi:secreted PhoX family phosphatase
MNYYIPTGNRRVIVELEKGTELTVGYPDGMAIDTEGKLWVACFFGISNFSNFIVFVFGEDFAIVRPGLINNIMVLKIFQKIKIVLCQFIA